MTKIYEIMPINSDKAIKAINGIVGDGCFGEFAKFVGLAYQQDGNRSKIIHGDFYELFIKIDANAGTGGFYEEFKNLGLEKIPYSEYLFSFFNGGICFAVKEQNRAVESSKHFIITTTIEEFEEECKNIAIFENVNLYSRKTPAYAYKVAFNSEIFVVLDEYGQRELKELHESPNLLKVLLIQLLALSYKAINDKFVAELRVKFDEISADEIIELRKKFFNYKITSNYEVKESRKEAFTIFNMVKEYLNLEKEYREISQSLADFFSIKDEEQKREELKEKALLLKEKEEERAKLEKQREKRDKFTTRITIIAAFITILTFISVIADIFNLLDRFKG